MNKVAADGLRGRYANEIAQALDLIEDLGPGISVNLGIKNERAYRTSVSIGLTGHGNVHHPQDISVFEENRDGSFLAAARRAVQRYKRRRAGETFA